jgi:hypothetical protein
MDHNFRTLRLQVNTVFLEWFHLDCHFRAVIFTIQLGSNTLEGDDPNRIVVSTSTYYLHPDFNPDTIDNDIAVIELRMPIMLNGNLTKSVLVSLLEQIF